MIRIYDVFECPQCQTRTLLECWTSAITNEVKSVGEGGDAVYGPSNIENDPSESPVQHFECPMCNWILPHVGNTAALLNAIQSPDWPYRPKEPK